MVLTIFWNVTQYSMVKLTDVWGELTASRNVNEASSVSDRRQTDGNSLFSGDATDRTI
jgi:hypothetical protein